MLLVTVRVLRQQVALAAAAVHMVGPVPQAHLGRVMLEEEPLAALLAEVAVVQVHLAVQQALILAGMVALAVLQALTDRL